MSTASILIACKGRLHHLRQSVPLLLTQEIPSDVEYDIIVCDYGCPDQTFAWCRAFGDSRLKCVRVQDEVEWFNFSRCLNIAANFSQSDVLVKIDADQLVQPDWLQTIWTGLRESQRQFLLTAVVGKAAPLDAANSRYHFPDRMPLPPEMCTLPPGHACPGMAFTRELFHCLRGFDESFEGWGHEDSDFSYRALQWLKSETCWVPYRGAFLNHSREESVRFYRNQDPQDSAARNLARQRMTDRTVNPTGYGVTSQFELFGLTSDASGAGKWNDCYQAAGGSVPYGNEESYRIAADFLRGVKTVEDWGCGYAWAKRYFDQDTTYLGIDGSQTPFADRIVDLREYRSTSEGVLLRHVLEHNWCWRQILVNALASFGQRLCVVLFLSPNTTREAVLVKHNAGVIAPDLSLPQPVIEELLDQSGCFWERRFLEATGEWIYQIRRAG